MQTIPIEIGISFSILIMFTAYKLMKGIDSYSKLKTWDREKIKGVREK